MLTPGTPAIAYRRVSTTKQGVSGLGLEAQEAAVLAFVASRGLQLIERYTEIETGTRKRRRPVLAAALEHTRRTGAVLLIAKLDRLARNVAVVSSLMESGVRFVAVDMPEVDNLTVHVMAAVAEREAAQISSRTKAALGVVKARGVQLGTPENMTHEAQLKGAQVQREAAQAAERKVAGYVALLRRDGLSYAKIAKHLTAEGHVSRQGKQLTAMHIKRIVDRAAS
jgi:DNA invertase Pin-like site-specific DNA recombinase